MEVRSDKFKYLIYDNDRHGNTRWYLRKKGAKKIRLPSGPGAPGFPDAYQLAFEELKTQSTRIPVVKPQSFIYFIRVHQTVKIGYSSNPLNRLSQLLTSFPWKPDGFLFIRGTVADEQRLHREFKTYQENREWFRANLELDRVMAYAAARGHLPSNEVKTRTKGPTAE